MVRGPTTKLLLVRRLSLVVLNKELVVPKIAAARQPTKDGALLMEQYWVTVCNAVLTLTRDTTNV